MGSDDSVSIWTIRPKANGPSKLCSSKFASNSKRLYRPSRCPGCRFRLTKRSAATFGLHLQYTSTSTPGSEVNHAVGVPDADVDRGCRHQDAITAPFEVPACRRSSSSAARLSVARQVEFPTPWLSNRLSRRWSLSRNGSCIALAIARPMVDLPLAGNPETTTKRRVMRRQTIASQPAARCKGVCHA